MFANYSDIFLKVSFISCIWVTYQELRQNNFITMVFAGSCAVYLNPFYPIHLNETTQTIMYLIFSVGFFLSTIVDFFKGEPNHESSKFGS